MFEYKDASFYTSYFKNHPGFNVLEEFKESEEEEEIEVFKLNPDGTVPLSTMIEALERIKTVI